MAGRCEISAAIAFHVAEAMDVPLADALAAKTLPPRGICKHYGRSSDE